MGKTGIAQRRFVVLRDRAAVAGDQRRGDAARAARQRRLDALASCASAASAMDVAMRSPKVSARVRRDGRSPCHRQSRPRRCDRRTQRARNRSRPARPAPAAASGPAVRLNPASPGRGRRSPRGTTRARAPGIAHAKRRDATRTEHDPHALAVDLRRSRCGHPDRRGRSCGTAPAPPPAPSRSLASAKPSESAASSAPARRCSPARRSECDQAAHAMPAAPMQPRQSSGRLERTARNKCRCPCRARPAATMASAPARPSAIAQRSAAPSAGDRHRPRPAQSAETRQRTYPHGNRPARSLACNQSRPTPAQTLLS